MKVKLKDLGILPKERTINLTAMDWDNGYNQALKEVGEVEIGLDVEKMRNIMIKKQFKMDGMLTQSLQGTAEALNNSIKDIIRRVE